MLLFLPEISEVGGGFAGGGFEFVAEVCGVVKIGEGCNGFQIISDIEQVLFYFSMRTLKRYCMGVQQSIQTPGIQLIDNRAVNILCYDRRYTFVEKLQTIASKFRKEVDRDEVATNYMRQYYDVYLLLGDTYVQSFIGSDE